MEILFDKNTLAAYYCPGLSGVFVLRSVPKLGRSFPQFTLTRYDYNVGDALSAREIYTDHTLIGLLRQWQGTYGQGRYLHFLSHLSMYPFALDGNQTLQRAAFPDEPYKYLCQIDHARHLEPQTFGRALAQQWLGGRAFDATGAYRGSDLSRVGEAVSFDFLVDSAPEVLACITSQELGKQEIYLLRRKVWRTAAYQQHFSQGTVSDDQVSNVFEQDPLKVLRQMTDGLYGIDCDVIDWRQLIVWAFDRKHTMTSRRIAHIRPVGPAEYRQIHLSGLRRADVFDLEVANIVRYFAGAEAVDEEQTLGSAERPLYKITDEFYRRVEDQRTVVVRRGS